MPYNLKKKNNIKKEFWRNRQLHERLYLQAVQFSIIGLLILAHKFYILAPKTFFLLLHVLHSQYKEHTDVTEYTNHLERSDKCLQCSQLPSQEDSDSWVHPFVSALLRIKHDVVWRNQYLCKPICPCGYTE